MFPLSTPVHSGLLNDWLSLAIVLGGLCAFLVGLHDIVDRLRGRRREVEKGGGKHGAGEIDVVTLCAYGLMALVGLSVAAMLAGAPGIPVAQVVFLLMAAWGLVRSTLVASSCIRHSTFDIRPTETDIPHTTYDIPVLQSLAFALAAFCSLWFWADAFRDHVALPSAHDGIVHTTYYLRLLEAGVPTLGRVPIGFGGVFGAQYFEFYPTGTHALVAITSGFWGEWGVVSHAGILKAWLTLAMAAAPFALLWFVRRLMPRLPWWVGLALVFAAIPGFRFPVEAAHEGGTSRILAHVLMAPIYADVLLGRFRTCRTVPVAGVCLGLAFLLHPSAFVTLAAVLAYAACFSVMESRQWRVRVAASAGLACSLAIGAGGALVLLRWNGGAAIARDAAQAFSWPALVARFEGGWTTLFNREYGMGVAPRLATLLGLVLLVARRNAFAVSRRVVVFPFFMAIVAAASLAAQVVSLPGSRLLGGAFYDELPRVIEILYEPIGLCLAAAGWFASTAAIAFASRRSRLGGALRPAFLLPALLVVFAAGYAQARDAWVHDHFADADRRFGTPRISRLRNVGAWLETRTEREAIVFHAAFDAEIWEAWTGRRGIFMYGECQPHGSHPQKSQQACEQRKKVIARAMDTLVWSLDHPEPAAPCLGDIERFRRPGYFLVVSSFRSTEPWQTCRDATYLTTLDGRAIFAYRRP